MGPKEHEPHPAYRIASASGGDRISGNPTVAAHLQPANSVSRINPAVSPLLVRVSQGPAGVVSGGPAAILHIGIGIGGSRIGRRRLGTEPA